MSFMKSFCVEIPGSELREIPPPLLLPSRYLAISVDVSVFHNWQNATGIYSVEAKDAAKHLIIHSPHHKELSRPKC